MTIKATFKGYIGHVDAERGHFLLGGVVHHDSVMFETLSDANKWVSEVTKTNVEAGRKVADCWIEPIEA